MNIAILRGTLSSAPRTTELPSGSTVHNYEVVTVDRQGGRQTVPVAWIDPARPPRVDTDDEVVVVGSVRRRWFRAGGATVSRTEILASVVARPGSERARKAVRAAIESAADTSVVTT